jgi:hypothetical protein
MAVSYHSARPSASKTSSGGAADALRSTWRAEYKHVVLGLIFPSTSPTPSRRVHARLAAEIAQGTDPRYQRITCGQHILGAQRGPLELPTG